MIDYGLVLRIFFTGKKYVLRNNNYEEIDWKDESPKPSKSKLESLYEEAVRMQAENDVREKRDTLLEKSDWIVIMNNEKNQPISDNWKQYRQALRDISKQDKFPFEVEWPLEPS